MIQLDHTIVPARDKMASAEFFAEIFGLTVKRGYFAEVRVNDRLTLAFADQPEVWGGSDFNPGNGFHHYAFHVSDAEFDAIFERIKKAGLVYGSAPWSLEDGELNVWNGGRGVYFDDPDGHLFELMTAPYSAEPEAQPPKA